MNKKEKNKQIEINLDTDIIPFKKWTQRDHRPECKMKNHETSRNFI